MCSEQAYSLPGCPPLDRPLSTGERPFICRGSNQPGVFDSCGMTFSDPSSCGRHEKHRHGKLDRNGTAPMTHKCPQCNAVYVVVLSALRVHMTEYRRFL
jgi:hypothetical protein